MGTYILALDQGTTSSRAIVFDRLGDIVSKAQYPFRQLYPQAGWVEHDPMEIWETERRAAAQAAEGLEADIAGIGVTNQRETTILWDKVTGRPVYNAIVWQCRRTAELCEELKRQGLEERVQSATGLLIDAYFSATKIRWVLDNVPGAREKADRGGPAVRHGGNVAHLAADRGPRHGLFQRLPHHAVRYPPPVLGCGAVRAVGRPYVYSAPACVQ